MFLSAVSVLVVAQSSSEIPEGLMNNPVFLSGLRHFVACLSTQKGHLRAIAVPWGGIYIEHFDSGKSFAPTLSTSVQNTRYDMIYLLTEIG